MTAELNDGKKAFDPSEIHTIIFKRKNTEETFNESEVVQHLLQRLEINIIKLYEQFSDNGSLSGLMPLSAKFIELLDEYSCSYETKDIKKLQ